MKIIYIMGITCVGKSTFIDTICGLDNNFGKVQVGKEFRRRYSADHFKGQGAPEHTLGEALEILDMLVRKQLHKKVILVDGQPRDLSQVTTVMGRFTDNEEVWWLNADKDTISDRLFSRFLHDPEGADLAIARLQDDRTSLYEVMWRLCSLTIPITTIEHHNNFQHANFLKIQGY